MNPLSERAENEEAKKTLHKVRSVSQAVADSRI